jgi:chromosomal replication initiation ATPase DnaA
MDLSGQLAPQVLTSAMLEHRVLVPEDSDVIDRLFQYLKTARPTMIEIKQVVCEFYDIEPHEITGGDRRPFITFARHVFCYFARHYTRNSLRQIGMRVGYVDHSTTYYGIRRIEGYAVTRQLVRDDLDLIRLRICEKLLLRQQGGPRC